MGENGAGKSAPVKIMAGLHSPDKGAIRVHGHNVLFRSTSQAQHAGVSVIYQEPALFLGRSYQAVTTLEGARPRAPHV